jgi:hypothetical protein
MATLIRYGCASAAAGDDRHQGDRDLLPIRPQKLQQPPHQPRVVCLAEDLVFVHLVIGKSGNWVIG